MSLEIASAVTGSTATITLVGELDAASAPAFREAIEKATTGAPNRLVLELGGLSFMASAGLRVLIFAKQKLGTGVSLYVVAPQAPVLDTLEKTGFVQSVYVVASAPT
ncbi:MAG TPA: anti-sigma factor antagonist [Acetobacteraceae bacterium]|nr:anti-sigma factor antagonist [Acetobacteraceae bacterium]